jgi:glycosyltransferase involved in cell wall biosynthesis
MNKILPLSLATIVRVATDRASRMIRYPTLLNNCAKALHSSMSILENSPPKKDGVLFIGYAEAGLGLGESFRNLVAAIAGTSTRFAIYPFNINVESRHIGPYMEHCYDRNGRYDINVIEMATDQLPFLYQELGSRCARPAYNILRTYWELPTAPKTWARMLECIDEIWAPNQFVATAFKHIFNGPIVIIPPCVRVDRNRSFARDHFRMEEDRFYFIFTFDHFSFAERKNPLGILRVFLSAFPDPSEKVGLVIKSTGLKEQNATVRAKIAQAATRDSRIIIIDDTLRRDEILSLIAQSDCYVSLHRSEGFGLGMAEALALGKPVVGTDYSGSTDFLSLETGFPVPYSIRPLVQGEYIEGEGQSWAEPDERAAVQILRCLRSDPAEAIRRAKAGQAFIEARYSIQNVGNLAAARLALVRKERAGQRTTIQTASAET